MLFSKMNKKCLLWCCIVILPSWAVANQYSCTTGSCPSLGTNTTFTTTANNQVAVFVQNLGSIATGTTVQISTAGANSAGIHADASGAVRLTSNGIVSQITTSDATGNLSPGVLITNSGVVDLVNYMILTSQQSINNGVTITNNIVSFIPNTFNLSSTSLPNGMRSGIAVLNGDAISVINTGVDVGANINLNTVTVDAVRGALLRASGGGPSTGVAFANFTATNSLLHGEILGDEFNIINVNFTDTVWTGSTGSGLVFGMDMQSLLGTNGSIWFMTGSSQILNNLTNGGLIYFVEPPSNSMTFKTLTAGTYDGINGNLSMNAFLAGDNSPADRLVLLGGTQLQPQVVATGNTSIEIRNFGGPGAFTVHNGILLVLVPGGENTTQPTAFHLSKPVVAGPYEYFLFHGSVDNSGPENWYLRTNNPLIPLRFLNFPYYRSETSLYSTLPSLAVLYTRGIISTLHQRVSQQNFSEYPNSYCGNLEFGKGGWFRFINGGGDINNGNIFEHGANFKYHYLALQTGYDLYHQLYSWGGRDYSGLMFTMGDATGNVEHFTGVNAGENSLWGTSLGAYYTYYGQMGWYVDGVLMGNYFNMQSDPRRLQAISPNGNGVAGSLEAGYPFHVNDKTSLEPQAQMIYQTLTIDDATDQGASVRFNRTRSVLSRVGVLIGKTWCPNTGFLYAVTRNISGWARLNYWHEASGTSTTNFSSGNGWVPFKSELAGNFFQADFGVSTHITKALSFYADAGGGYYLQNKGRFYSVDAGFRMSI